MTGQSIVQQHCLLQEGLSCALATLHAIEGASLLSALPADPDAAERHNHGIRVSDHWIARSVARYKFTAVERCACTLTAATFVSPCLSAKRASNVAT